MIKINLLQYIQDFCPENTKTLLSEIKDLNKERYTVLMGWKAKCCYDGNLPKLICRSNVVTINISASFVFII